ncbi:hypothetical protein [Phyllobacterium meliloti]|uniref:hypothetical protein n=1 Tax=Phyllobacterium meliloti TaxID=555317 RepID=UPI001D13A256|nr:hypothetical protein [Phyllobacterium sp. T1293]UGX87133.1 hypothetical protein LLE53_004610 [Phyllobacterium sp. T1293]
MLIRFEPNGKITHIRSDPDTQELIDAVLAESDWLHEAGVQLPPMPFFTPKGEPILGEDGEQIVDSPGIQMPVVQLHTHYVINVDGEWKVAERPIVSTDNTEIKADGVDAFIVDRLPKPCAFLLDGEPIEVTDGTLEFSTEDAGTYVFETVFPFVDARWTVTAIEAVKP